MTTNEEAAELPSMLIQRWRAEAAAHERRAEELSYGYPIFADRYEKKAEQKKECAAQLESALSASAEPAGTVRAHSLGLPAISIDWHDGQPEPGTKLYAHAPPASCNPTTQPASVPGDWMPIETAPKNEYIQLGRAATDECDGVSLQGFWQEGHGDGQDYMGQDSGFVDSDFQQFHGGRSFGAESSRYKPNQPTHWKPRSPPPTTPETRT